MQAQSCGRCRRLLSTLPELGAMMSGLIGVLGLVGFLLGFQGLRPASPSAQPILPSTAVGLIALAFALACFKSGDALSRVHFWVGRGASAAVLLLGAITLFASVTDAALGDPLTLSLTPPETSVCLVLAALALLLLNPRGVGGAAASQCLALAVIVLTMLALSGYLTGGTSLFSPFLRSVRKGMAVNTALGLFFVALGIVASRTDAGFMRLLCSPTSGGLIARRAAVTFLLLTPAVGALGLLGRDAGVLSDSLRLALSSLVGVAVFLVLTWLTASQLDRADRARQHMEERLAESEARLEILAKAGRSLLNSLSYDDVLTRVTSVAVPAVSDWCSIYIVDEAGELSRRAMTYRDSSANEGAKQVFREYKPSPCGRGGVFECVRTGKVFLSTEVTEEQLLALDQDPQLTGALRELVQSCVIVPMVLRGRVIGALVLGCGESGRRFYPHHVDLVQELANTAAMAFDNADLYDRAQRSIKAREEVVAIVSHDLRSPLAAIRLNASLLCAAVANKQRAEERLRADVERAGAAIQRSVTRMDSLIKDLLILAKVEAGRLLVEKAPTDVSAVLNDLTDMFQHAAEEKGLSLVIEARGDLRDIDLDRDRVLQALSNLVCNAIKFTPSGGRIGVKAELFGGELAISVSDTGPGVAKEHLPHIFDRYWQPRESAKKGTGLGLFIAKGIVEAHGGRIWAESLKGQGSVFHVSLPAEERGSPTAGPRSFAPWSEPRSQAH